MADAMDEGLIQQIRTLIKRDSLRITQHAHQEYELREIIHPVRSKGKLIVIDHVPADVCTVCGDVLLSPETVRHIESILKKTGKPETSAPVFEYA